ncbi:MAG: hypothetical protein AB8H80_09935 [Planctomycetota bacterium]
MLSRVAACATFAGFLHAQSRPPAGPQPPTQAQQKVATHECAEMLARFANDNLPQLMLDLHGPNHDRAVRGLKALGPHIHVFLLGKARQPLIYTHRDFSDAFAEFGPDCDWAMPALLEATRHSTMLGTMQGLAKRLGATAKPLAAALTNPSMKRLRQQLLQLPDEEVDPRPLHAARVDPKHRAALLQLLRDDSNPEQWWPALQALLAIDFEASLEARLDACDILLARRMALDVAVQRRSEELLHAISCYHAATASMSTELLERLPADLDDELLRSVLALSPRVPPKTERVAATRYPALPRKIAVSERPVHRLATALAGAMHRAQVEASTQDVARLTELAADDDRRIARMAQAALRINSDRNHEWFAQPAAHLDQRALQRAEQASPATLAKFGVLRLREALADLPDPEGFGDANPAANDVPGRILQGAARAALRNAMRVSINKRFVKTLVLRAPALVADQRLTPTEHRKLVAIVFQQAELPEALHDWAFEHAPVHVAKHRPGPRHPLPIACAPSVSRALADPARCERAVSLLHALRRTRGWTDLVEQHLDRLLELAAARPGAVRSQILPLLRFSEATTRAVERVLLDNRTDPDLRDGLAKSAPPSRRFPPDPEFVLAALSSPHESLRRHGRLAAACVQERQDDITDLLARQCETLAEDELLQSLYALGRLGNATAVRTLEQNLKHAERAVRTSAAFGLLRIDGHHQAATEEVTRQLDASDGSSEAKLQLWSGITISAGASAHFLDRAKKELLLADRWQMQARLLRVLRTAHAELPKQARAALLEMTGCGNASIEDMAQREIQVLDRSR